MEYTFNSSTSHIFFVRAIVCESTAKLSDDRLNDMIVLRSLLMATQVTSLCVFGIVFYR